MSNGQYILNESGEPIEASDLMEWARFFEHHSNRHVARETIGDASVSTVFLALDHRYGDGDPILWETMVFGGSMSEHQERCGGNRANALEMHQRVLQQVKESQP